MAIMVMDEIETPAGRSQIKEIKRARMNQHSSKRVYVFANGSKATTKHNWRGEQVGEMIFK